MRDRAKKSPWFQSLLHRRGLTLQSLVASTFFVLFMPAMAMANLPGTKTGKQALIPAIWVVVAVVLALYALHTLNEILQKAARDHVNLLEIDEPDRVDAVKARNVERANGARTGPVESETPRVKADYEKLRTAHLRQLQRRLMLAVFAAIFVIAAIVDYLSYGITPA